MPFDSDVALLGTGVAPLVAANYLLGQGKSVLLLNPDRDFFLEDSELPLDPLLQDTPSPKRLARSSPENALAELRPDFPGAIEFWSAHTGKQGFHDPDAPHVRQRGRLWMSSFDKNRLWNWEELEDLYVEASDAGFNPQILEGLQAAKRFPGFSGNAGTFRGLMLPKLCDVDTVRYRNGLLEFVRERLPLERVVCAVNQIDCMPEGIRFHANGTLNTAKLKDGMLVFWTPQLSTWVLNQAKKAEVQPKLPRGVRLWEQWSLNSRDEPDPGMIGMLGDMAVWADFEGIPPENKQSHRLAVLRSGPLVSPKGLNLPQQGLNWASAQSFGSLSNLCHNFLKWDRFSIHSLRARAIFEWENEESWLLTPSDPLVQVVTACDGPLVDVVRVARSACERLLREN
jgi:hypothetical protein